MNYKPPINCSVSTGSRCQFIASIAAWGSMALAVLVLFGWIFHFSDIKSTVPGLATMKFNTALCFLLSGCRFHPFGDSSRVSHKAKAIVAVTQNTLERFGYRVLTATDGATAVAKYAQNQNDIAVVLTDTIMPVMDGAALSHTLLKINPNVQVISASGFGSESGNINTHITGVRHHLQKPYTADVLLKLLHQLINESNSELQTQS